MADIEPGRPVQPAREPTPPAEQDWFSGRRWTGIGAIGVLVVIALCAGLLIFHGRGNKPSAAPAATISPAAQSPAAGDEQIPTSPPPGVTWSLYQSVALPSSTTAGPRNVSGDIATGYSHTPTGALVAAQQISIRYLLSLDSDWRFAAYSMLAPGPGRNAWVGQRSKISHSTPDPAGTYNQVAGFNFLSYTPTDAVIQLASRSTSGSLQVVAEHLTWLDNDWRLVLSPDGGEATSVQPLEDLGGFVPWAGA